MHTLPLWAWGAFLIFIIAMLALDLGVFRRGSHTIKLKEALTWCGIWFSLAMAFNAVVWTWLGPKRGLEWTAGYLIEIALSVDNVFVFIVIFTYFQVSARRRKPLPSWPACRSTHRPPCATSPTTRNSTRSAAPARLPHSSKNARERLASTLTPEQLERYERALGLWIPRLTTPPPLPRN
ncbi:MAG: hypothetical protein J6386_13750 [Candidatus Synoicihabitans palmerolidicus]|nr:hypothetical protein [Candidatus Synoicihabitans palmerolidicus]